MIEIRAPRPEELKRVAKEWAFSFRPHVWELDGDSFATVGSPRRGISPGVWGWAHRAYIDHRLHECRDYVVVADDGDRLAGFVAFSLPDGDRRVLTIHYLWTHQGKRRQGIGTRLLEAARKYSGFAPIRTTHTTPAWAHFMKAQSDAHTTGKRPLVEREIVGRGSDSGVRRRPRDHDGGR